MEKSCLNCRHQYVCIQRTMAIFLMYIQTGRYAELEDGQKKLDISADCSNYDEKNEGNA